MDLLELTSKKDVLFIIGDWNAKVGSQETLGVTGKFGLGMRNEAGQRLIEFCRENALVIANTLFQQQKRRLYTWTSPDGQIRKPTYDPAIPLLGICPGETTIERDTCTPLFIAALFTIARTWKQPSCPSTGEWIKKCGIYTQWNILLSYKKEHI